MSDDIDTSRLFIVLPIQWVSMYYMCVKDHYLLVGDNSWGSLINLLCKILKINKCIDHFYIVTGNPKFGY